MSFAGCGGGGSQSGFWTQPRRLCRGDAPIRLAERYGSILSGQFRAAAQNLPETPNSGCRQPRISRKIRGRPPNGALATPDTPGRMRAGKYVPRARLCRGVDRPGPRGLGLAGPLRNDISGSRNPEFSPRIRGSGDISGLGRRRNNLVHKVRQTRSTSQVFGVFSTWRPRSSSGFLRRALVSDPEFGINPHPLEQDHLLSPD